MNGFWIIKVLLGFELTPAEGKFVMPDQISGYEPMKYMRLILRV